MSTITDHAVRAVTRVLGETTTGRDDAGPLSYWHRDCEHRACRMVTALADGDALDYAPEGASLSIAVQTRIIELIGGLALTVGGQSVVERITEELHRDALVRTTTGPRVRHRIVVDVETTGLDPSRHEVVEAAWWNLDTNDRGTFVPVHQPNKVMASADIKALQLNRYVDRLATAEQDTNFRKIRAMAAELGGATLIGANPAFDAVMLRKLFERHEDEVGFVPAWHHRLWDVEAYAAGVLALPELVGLAKLCEILGAAPSDHTAAGDVTATATCYSLLRELADGAAASTDADVWRPRVDARAAVAS